MPLRLGAAAALSVAAFALHAQPAFPWQQEFSRALPNGELAYVAEPFRFEAGASQRHIDFAGGDDANPGTREQPWKHHPWDPAARGNAQAAASEVHTYIFKGGVTYRGRFVVPDTARGTADNPIRLTRDPSWGEGPAVINGAGVVTGWRRGAHARMPDGDKVWVADVTHLPRAVWITRGDGEIRRLRLARWPNWNETDPNDLLSEWPAWDQPQWWTGVNKVVTAERGEQHLGVSSLLPRPLEDLQGGTVWSEWGFVMGSPYPAKIVEASDRLGGVAFRGPWTFQRSENIATGNRFHLEDLPQFLDEPGEFWVERTQGRNGRLYLRLPNDADPNLVTVEAAREYDILTARSLEHVHVTALTFRFQNVGWDYNDPQWAHPDLRVGVIRLAGSGDGIVVAHNLFEHVMMPVRIALGDPAQRIGTVVVRDNHMRDTDHGAILVESATADGVRGRLEHVEVLRNRLERIGMRNLSGMHGHAVIVEFPDTSLIAGNHLHRIAGWGIAVFGGKPSGNRMAGIEAPLSRHLVFQNRVHDVLLKSNDWGGIETWQGGTHYVFNNIVINPVGFKNWVFRPGDPENIGSFAHAYYMDGSFKNYLFNNIGLGLNNTLGTKGVNATAIQNILSFENWYFNNSFHRFAETTRQQAPEAGRFRYLGNIFSDTSKFLYRHADARNTEPDPNASHFTQGGQFAYHTLAFAHNIVHRLTGRAGVFEENGALHATLEGFSNALERLNAQAADAGTLVDPSPLRNPDAMDWRPTPSAGETGVLAFVPWALARTVGEWQFTLNRANPAEIIDEHWFMHAGYADRHAYRSTQRFPLVGSGIDAASFTPGPLSDWTRSALRLDGRSQHLVVAHATLPAQDGVGTQAGPRSVDATTTSLIVEAYVRTSDRDGVVAAKMRDNVGYALAVRDGALEFTARTSAGAGGTVRAPLPEGGAWMHILGELDREAGTLALHVNGVRIARLEVDGGWRGSLANPADFTVGGGPDLPHLAAEFAFLRVALASLAESRTTIGELHAWQFDGPQFRDFAGQDRRRVNNPGALVRQP